ncbi:MAG TPA: ferritin [bacterium]|nr:ferritin [bacterium]HQO33625.1 ferritin [bacterium]
MIDKKMQNAINDQINAEMFSAYLYLSMSAYFENTSLRGFANWMRVQAQEEMVHAMKFFDYVIERGGRAVLKAIEAPADEWASPVAAFEAAYEHEQKVTARINKLVDIAVELRDHATNAFLQWFVTEQVEEEASASEIVDKLKLIGEARGGLFMMDRELAARVFTPPAASEA